VNRHDDHVRSFSFYYDQPIQRAGLVVWLNMLADLRGADLLRVKGILNVEGEPVVVHAVQTIIHEPVVLSHWPSEERRSRIVMIVRDISRQELERTFEAFQFSVNPVEPDNNAFDPASYSRFMQAAAKFRH
jgi:G3E family GTPase